MSQRDLTQGPVGRTLFALTAPMMVAVSSSILVQVIEIGFIGQLGTDQVAAMTFTFPVTMALSSIALGVSIGTSSVIARSVGAGNTDDVHRLGTHSLILVAALMSVLSIVGWLLVDPLFVALGAQPNTLALIRGYMNFYYPGVVLFTTTMVAGSVLRANGNAAVPGAIMTVAALLNLILDPILIFGWSRRGRGWTVIRCRSATGSSGRSSATCPRASGRSCRSCWPSTAMKTTGA